MEGKGVGILYAFLEIDGIVATLRMEDRRIKQARFLRVELYPEHMRIAGMLNGFDYFTVCGPGRCYPSQAQSLDGLMAEPEPKRRRWRSR